MPAQEVGMPGIYPTEIFFLFILFVFTIISVVYSIKNRKDPLTESRISTSCPCCGSKNITFQSISVATGKPFSIIPMLNFISYYVFSIINIFIILNEEEEVERAFFQALSGTQVFENIDSMAKSMNEIYVFGYTTKIFLIAGTVFLIICMLMPNETENQLAKICMDCGTVSNANSAPEAPRKEEKEEAPQWASPTKKNN